METQADRVVTMGYLLQELPLILEEEPAVRRTIIRIFRDRFAERDITEDRFEHLFRELKEGREESRKRWEEQNRKWEEQTRKSDKKWEEQNKKWEEQSRKWDKKWEEQDKKWEEQNKKWEEQDKKWERTEHRLDRLEKIVGELALAQKRTEEALRTLTATVGDMKKDLGDMKKDLGDVKKGLGDVRKQVGGLSMTVGYGLEDKLFPYVRDFVKKEFGAEMTVTDRRNLIYPDGKHDEINIYAEGTKDGHTLFIIGECKAQPGKKDFDRMDQMLVRVRKAVNGDIHPFLVGYHFSPDVEAYAKKTYPHIRICKSFEFGLKYKKI